MNLKTLVAIAALSASACAHADVTGSFGSLSNSYLELTSAGLTGYATLEGGTVYTAGTFIDAVTASPIQTVGNYLTAGTVAGESATLTFTTGVTQVSFMWGSPDASNLLTATTNDGVATQFQAQPMGFTDVTGNQSYGEYVTLTAGAGQTINTLTFTNNPSFNAMEASNFAVTAAVPEPETYAMMLAGLLGIGYLGKKRQGKSDDVNFTAVNPEDLELVSGGTGRHEGDVVAQ